MDGMERNGWKGSFLPLSLSSRSALHSADDRLVGPPSGAAAAHLSGTGPRGGRKEDEDDRGEEDGRRNEGRSRGGGLSLPPSEESNRERSGHSPKLYSENG